MEVRIVRIEIDRITETEARLGELVSEGWEIVAAVGGSDSREITDLSFLFPYSSQIKEKEAKSLQESLERVASAARTFFVGYVILQK